MLTLLSNLKESDKKNAVEELIKDSTPHQDFYLMVILSILMATFGLLLNSTAIIIGSMLIAPILYPILSLALGITIADGKLIARSFYTILKSVIFGITAAFIVTVFFAHHIDLTPEILARTQPSILYGIVALIAGLAASFALVKPNLNEMLPGVAISAAIIPPIAVAGIGFSHLDWEIISSALILFLTNAAGIIFTSVIIFSLMNLYLKRHVATETIKKEDKILAKEKNNKELKTKKPRRENIET